MSDISIQSAQIAGSLAANLDDLITASIENHTGQPVILDDLARNSTCKRFPGGVEVFSYHGVDLIEIHPPEFNTSCESGSYKMTASRKYRHLV